MRADGNSVVGPALTFAGMAKKAKFYTVWLGHVPGVYTTWAEAKQQVEGYKGAKYKSFPSRAQAEAAFDGGYQRYLSAAVSSNAKHPRPRPNTQSNTTIIQHSISTDAACSGNPGKMEYQGVTTATGKQLFHRAFPVGTNNIGEFLGIVHGLAFLKAQELTRMPIYTDSKIAMGWVRKGKCKTTLKRSKRTELLFEYVDRAEAWLKTNEVTNPILKWETKRWGEIPADFGRK